MDVLQQEGLLNAYQRVTDKAKDTDNFLLSRYGDPVETRI
jgi:hypothetical protein